MLKGTVSGNDEEDFYEEADDGTSYDEVFDEIMGSNASEGTLSFVESLADNFEQYGHLTPRQHVKLMEIWAKIKGE